MTAGHHPPISPQREAARRSTGPNATRPPLVRASAGGVLMGLAMLVPGVSGGTMILVIGLYDEFISSIADVTRLRFSRRNVLFLTVVGGLALVAIALLAGTMSRAVLVHRSAMFSLFIGLTLGGVPLLVQRLKRVSIPAVVGLLVGLALMAVIATTSDEAPTGTDIRAAAEAGELTIKSRYAKDVAAGALGMSAMVLPGVSGAYMLLLLGRYETILASVALAKDYAASFGRSGDTLFLQILIPVAFGAVMGLVTLSNFLKWMLHRHESLTLGLLLGIVLGSVMGIWPFGAESQSADYLIGGALAAAGLGCTWLLSRISA